MPTWNDRPWPISVRGRLSRAGEKCAHRIERMRSLLRLGVVPPGPVPKLPALPLPEAPGQADDRLELLEARAPLDPLPQRFANLVDHPWLPHKGNALGDG